MFVDAQALDFAIGVLMQLSMHPEHDHMGKWCGMGVGIAEGVTFVPIYLWSRGENCRWSSPIPPFSRPGHG